jgi:creatinine amidohydrolase
MTLARLAAATWPEVEAAVAGAEEPSLLLVPLGATEQHGPHLPLGVDTEIAVALAEAAALAAPGAVAAPALPFGSSGEHGDFPGTLSIGAAATELVLVELGRSACETFSRLLFVCAHGGNAAPLTAAVARLRGEGRDVRAWSPAWGGDAHAGRTETSVMLALDAGAGFDVAADPDAAERGRALLPYTGQRSTAVRAEQAEPGNGAPLADLIGRLRTDGVRAVSPNGVLGDPTGASAAEGRRMLTAAAAELLAAIAGWPTPATTRAPTPETVAG